MKNQRILKFSTQCVENLEKATQCVANSQDCTVQASEAQNHSDFQKSQTVSGQLTCMPEGTTNEHE